MDNRDNNLEKDKKQSKPEVLIVGTFHFTKGGDLVDSSTAVDIQSDEEQIKELVSILAQFSPSALAVEITKDRNEALNKEYQEYLKYGDNFERNEVHQVMFRLGKQLGHSNIHALDWMESVGNRGIGDVAEWAKEYQKDKFDSVMKVFNDNPIRSDNSILDNLQLINDPTYQNREHRGYMNLAQIGEGEEYVGIDWLRWWYQRNLTLYKNVVDIIHSGNEKVLLLIGAAHVYLLKQFIEESGEANVIIFNDFLNDI
ncbi:DUF5694 domain-containing protein [Salinicoccus sesuvii]|uniref:DUF5694 domain-containing protein n=1 Tax=Salinicoccus sesuvii TaxID=868281 RepID=A0ABV7N610_9STAP